MILKTVTHKKFFNFNYRINLLSTDFCNLIKGIFDWCQFNHHHPWGVDFSTVEIGKLAQVTVSKQVSGKSCTWIQSNLWKKQKELVTDFTVWVSGYGLFFPVS